MRTLTERITSEKSIEIKITVQLSVVHSNDKMMVK